MPAKHIRAINSLFQCSPGIIALEVFFYYGNLFPKDLFSPRFVADNAEDVLNLDK